MITKRLPSHDPRTIARDIPGVFDALFPQLMPGIVAHLNRRSISVAEVEPVSQEMVDASNLQHAMLFELAVVASEQLIGGQGAVDWPSSLSIAVERQRKHFDAKIPLELTEIDKRIALHVAGNLRKMLLTIKAEAGSEPLVLSPEIPGYQWIASGVGDFSVGRTLIEVKCTNKHFSSSDYRQIVIYWLLSYLAAIERWYSEWLHGILINPRLNRVVEFSFDEIIQVIAAGRSKIELLELFSTMIVSRAVN
jgi:hypothetical protein